MIIGLLLFLAVAVSWVKVTQDRRVYRVVFYLALSTVILIGLVL